MRALTKAVVVSLALLGCQSMRTPPRVGPPPPRVGDDQAEERFAQTLGRWTRRAEVYEGFDSRVFLATTYLSMDFRRARAERLAAFQSMPAAEVQAVLAVERTKHELAHEFILGVHANERRFDDFSRRESIWRVALVSSAGEALPLEIERLHRPDPNMRAVYPYIEQFWTAYLIRFPRSFPDGRPVIPETGSFVLRFSSTLGRADLVFDVDSPRRSGPSD